MAEKYKKIEFVDRVKIKWVSRFRLLRIQFCNVLSDMDINYEKGIKNMQDIGNNWNFRYLTIFSKLTVIKTYMLPQLTHVATVVRALTAKQIDEIHRVWNEYIHAGSQSVVNLKTTIYTPV